MKQSFLYDSYPEEIDSNNFYQEIISLENIWKIDIFVAGIFGDVSKKNYSISILSLLYDFVCIAGNKISNHNFAFNVGFSMLCFAMPNMFEEQLNAL